jgi:hypothetical protein
MYEIEGKDSIRYLLSFKYYYKIEKFAKTITQIGCYVNCFNVYYNKENTLW